MQEVEWPKRFYLLPAVRRNFTLFLLIPSAFMLGAALLRRDLVELVLVGFMAAWVGLWELKARRPAAEAWPDYVNVQGPGTWRFVSISYERITRLEEIPNIRFTVFYESSGKKRKVYIPAAFLPGMENLLELLQAKSGLGVTKRQPWWTRPLTKYGPLVAWDEPGAWMRGLLVIFVPVILYLYSMIGASLGLAWLADAGWIAVRPRFGVSLAIGLLAFVGSFLLVRQRRYLLVTLLTVPLTLAPVAAVWLRYDVVPPPWMWVPPAVAAIGLVVAAMASQGRNLRG